MGVTSDERVAELVEEIVSHQLEFKSLEKHTVPTDVIIVPLITGSPDYLKWVKI